MFIYRNQLNNEKFISSVWKWKYAGMFLWVSISYIIYILFAELLRYYFREKYSDLIFLFPFIFLAACVPLYFYSLSLTVVPVRKNVLSIKEFKNPIFYYITQFTWIFLHLSMYIRSLPESLAIAGLIIFTLLLYLDFAIILANFVSDSNKKPFKNRFSIFKEYCLYNVPLLPLVLSFLYFYCKNELYKGLIVTSTFYIVFLFTSICSLISGEKTSFTQLDNGERLRYGIGESKSQIVQYWAYNDLLNISNDENASRREFLFTKASSIGVIISDITEMIRTMSEKHGNISSSQPNTTNITPTYKPTKLREKVKRLIQKLKFFDGRRQRTMDMDKERKAVCNSIIAIMGTEALVQLILISEDEDKYGEIQQHAEVILDSIIDLYRACMRTLNLTWYTPPFGRQWIVHDYQKLTMEVLNTTYRAINNLTVRLGYRFDTTLIKNENTQIINSFLRHRADLPSYD